MSRRHLLCLRLAFALVITGCNQNKLVTQPAASATPTPAPGSHSDTFTQGSTSGKSDILFVVNNTDQTMVTKATRLGTSATGFANYLTTKNIDFHIGVTSMDMLTPCGGSVGSQGCLNGTPKMIDKTTPNLLATFQANLQVGFGGDGTELGLDAGIAAVASTAGGAFTTNTGFVRPDAKLFVVYVSDEDDEGLFPAATYLQHYVAAKGGNASMVTLNAIVGPVPNGCDGGSGQGAGSNGADAGTLYNAAMVASGGLFESICDPDYTTFLTNLGFQAGGEQSTFALSETPNSAGSIVVTVNGAASPSSDWSYSSATNSITFSASSIPPAGATVVITYQVG